MKKMLGLMIILIFALAACGGDNGKIVESAQNDAQDVVESVKDEIVVATEEEVVEQEVVEEAIKNTGDVVEEVSGEVDESMEAEVSDPSNVTFGTTAEEPVSSMLEGQVVDATTGTPLVEGLVCIQGTGLCASADGNGNYILADLPDGDWTLETTASGYFTAEQAVSIVAGETLTQNIVLSPEIVDGEIRIVLMWGGTSRDLDTWLKIPNGEDPTYLNYSNTGVEDSFPFAYLDLEDNGQQFGPETVTISKRVSGTYSYVVDIFESSSSFADVLVQVYGPTGLIDEFNGPTDGEGRSWWVFDLDGDTDTLTSVNLLDELPSE